MLVTAEVLKKKHGICSVNVIDAILVSVITIMVNNHANSGTWQAN